MVKTAISPQLEIARKMVASGISVIPIGTAKRPAIPWKEFQSRLPSEEELKEWYSTPDKHGIGMPCGKVSGNLEVIDFDIRDHKDLVQSANAYCQNVFVSDPDFPFEKIARVKTPHGLHLVYRCESPVEGSHKLLQGRGEGGTLQTLIETRGEGGYVLCAGSPAHCHPSGALYQHLDGPELWELEPITDQQRSTLLVEAKWNQNETEEARKEAVSVPVNIASPESAGSDFAVRTSWAEILLPHGFEHVGRSGETDQWKRPGTQNAVSATTNHDGSDLFFAFSPNCGYGIEAERGYSKFSMFTHLNHGGDFSASAKALAAAGFGTQRDLSHIDLSEILKDEPKPWVDPHGFETFGDFMSQPAEVEYFVKDIMAKRQSFLIAGPEKSLKTGIGVMDLGYSLATGTPFLGRFECPEAVRTGIMTGETSREKFQRQFRNRMESDALLFPDRPEPLLWITSSLPDMSSVDHLNQMRDVIQRYSLQVLIIDPAYLCMGDFADHTSNVSKMGNMLRQLDEVMRETGCTLVLLHHTNRKHEPGKPLTLRDTSGAGYAEWARQWILLSPRKPFDPDTYQHSLWMVAGGSAGHAGRYAVDVREKDDAGEWAWIADVRSESDEKQDYRESKEARKEEAETARSAEFVENLRTALNAGMIDGGLTLAGIKDVFRENGWKRIRDITTAKLEEFAEHGFVSQQTITRGDNPRVITWLPCEQWQTLSDTHAADLSA